MFMSLYNFNAILKIAQERDFKAIGSFNLHCIEMLPPFLKRRNKAIAH
ncbi:ketose-bisphosphate aldolase [Klebsiella michiganensis]|uniref:Ketose-bisphosphate aldolase n=1 Tax=Klebsiella michiganensis TaxID=1134687 RepID=A0A7H4M307_9ENTR|nr:ketose-bisphosphate aldolase [Klebsiella michiganensis]